MANPRNRPTKNVVLDPDMPGWLKAEAKRQSTNQSTIVRQAVRALMNAQQQTPRLAS